jgi:hypothetical protein
MKKLLIATAALTLMCGSAFAQTSTGPGAQNSNMTKGVTGKGSMKKHSMNSGTTGMSTGMKRGGMTRPDASGQGGSGPGSDQGGTRAAPGNIK